MEQLYTYCWLIDVPIASLTYVSLRIALCEYIVFISLIFQFSSDPAVFDKSRNPGEDLELIAAIVSYIAGYADLGNSSHHQRSATGIHWLYLCSPIYWRCSLIQRLPHFFNLVGSCTSQDGKFKKKKNMDHTRFVNRILEFHFFYRIGIGTNAYRLC